MTVSRRRVTHRLTLAERLAEDTAQLRDQASNMKPGVALDEVLRRIQQNEIAVQMREWLDPPGPLTPQ